MTTHPDTCCERWRNQQIHSSTCPKMLALNEKPLGPTASGIPWIVPPKGKK